LQQVAELELKAFLVELAAGESGLDRAHAQPVGVRVLAGLPAEPGEAFRNQGFAVGHRAALIDLALELGGVSLQGGAIVVLRIRYPCPAMQYQIELTTFAEPAVHGLQRGFQIAQVAVLQVERAVLELVVRVHVADDNDAADIGKGRIGFCPGEAVGDRGRLAIEIEHLLYLGIVREQGCIAGAELPGLFGGRCDGGKVQVALGFAPGQQVPHVPGIGAGQFFDRAGVVDKNPGVALGVLGAAESGDEQ
jgi:hypothetical protein